MTDGEGKSQVIDRARRRDQYYMGIAHAVKLASTCSRAHHGAVIVRHGTIIATGYNGSPRDTRHCDHRSKCESCNALEGSPEAETCYVFLEDDMENGHCSRAVHAEMNAVINAARHGGGTVGSIMYVTATPCYRCAPIIVNAGIWRVIYDNDYRPDPRTMDLFKEAGVAVDKITTIHTKLSGGLKTP